MSAKAHEGKDYVPISFMSSVFGSVAVGERHSGNVWEMHTVVTRRVSGRARNPDSCPLLSAGEDWVFGPCFVRSPALGGNLQ